MTEVVQQAHTVTIHPQEVINSAANLLTQDGEAASKKIRLEEDQLKVQRELDLLRLQVSKVNWKTSEGGRLNNVEEKMRRGRCIPVCAPGVRHDYEAMGREEREKRNAVILSKRKK